MVKQWLARLLPYWRAFFLFLLLGFGLGIVFANLSWRYREEEGGLFSLALLEGIGEQHPDFWNYFRYLIRQRAGIGVVYGGLGMTVLGVPAVMAGLLWLGFLGGALCTMGILQAGLQGFVTILGGIIPQLVVVLPGLFLFLAVVYQMSEKNMKKMKLSGRDYGSYLMWCSLGLLVFLLGTGLESFVTPKILQIIIENITKN